MSSDKQLHKDKDFSFEPVPLYRFRYMQENPFGPCFLSCWVSRSFQPACR